MSDFRAGSVAPLSASRGAAANGLINRALIYFNDSDGKYYQSELDTSDAEAVYTSALSGTCTDLKYDLTYDRILATFTDGVEIVDMAATDPQGHTWTEAGDAFHGIDYDRDQGYYFVRNRTDYEIKSLPWSDWNTLTAASLSSVWITSAIERNGLSCIDRPYTDNGTRNIWYGVTDFVQSVDSTNTADYVGRLSWGSVSFGGMDTDATAGSICAKARTGEYHSTGFILTGPVEVGIVATSGAGVGPSAFQITFLSVSESYGPVEKIVTPSGTSGAIHHVAWTPRDWVLYYTKTDGTKDLRKGDLAQAGGGSPYGVTLTNDSLVASSVPFTRFALCDRVL